jgi:hypothetical protein
MAALPRAVTAVRSPAPRSHGDLDGVRARDDDDDDDDEALSSAERLAAYVLCWKLRARSRRLWRDGGALDVCVLIAGCRGTAVLAAMARRRGLAGRVACAQVDVIVAAHPRTRSSSARTATTRPSSGCSMPRRASRTMHASASPTSRAATARPASATSRRSRRAACAPRVATAFAARPPWTARRGLTGFASRSMASRCASAFVLVVRACERGD